MIHPLLKSKGITIKYLGIWIFILGIHFLTLYFSADFSLAYSLVDSIVSGVIYVIITLGLWYTIRFGIQKSQSPLNMLVKNILLYIFTTVIWVFIVWGVVTIISSEWSVQFYSTILSYRIIASLMFYICSVVIYYAISFYESLQEKQVQAMQLKTLVREAQLNELRSQLHPHFLFNSLNSINSLTISDPTKAGEMIIKLSEFLRYSLSRKGHSMASFERELYHVRLYLDIEKVRFGKRLDFICIDDGVSPEWPIPLMLLQPLIENAVKHGVYNTGEKVTITLHAKTIDKMLHISIHNTIDPEAVPEHGTGTGLKNVRERLNLVYESNSLLETQLLPEGFTAILHIPYFETENSNNENTDH